MIQENLKYGHSIRLQFDIPKIELKEKETVLQVNKDLILNHELTGAKKENIRLIIAPHSNVTITEEFSGESEYADYTMKVTIGENAKVTFQSKQSLSENSTLNQKYFFNIDQGARLDLLNVLCGCKQLKHKTLVSLDGEGAECQNNCIYFSKNEQKFIIETSNVHNAKQTISNMLTKGALDGKSKVVNTGVVRIEPHSWGSNGYQKGDHLLLSKTAEVNPIPQLEIENHDVKCSHGVSITKIDDEKLFYFTSRGIPKKTAKSMFLQGFFSKAMKTFSEHSKEKIITCLFERNNPAKNFYNRSEAEVNKSF